MRISYLEGGGNGPSSFQSRTLNSDAGILERPGDTDVLYHILSCFRSQQKRKGLQFLPVFQVRRTDHLVSSKLPKITELKR